MVSAARKKTHVKKGDHVTVIAGNHRGSSGKVLQVLVKKNQVIVEGVRMIKKHARKSQDRPQGGIIDREGTLHISNVRRVETPKSEEAKPKKARAAAPKKEKAKE